MHASDRAGPGPAVLFGGALALFFVSGMAGLVYEVVWMRLLGRLFGHTVYAVTTVLAAYMAGLALGSLLAGRFADRVRRPLRWYALLEGGVALFCAATPFLFPAAEGLHAAAQRALQPGPLAAGALQFALALAILLPPTVLMGATLPLLARAVVRPGEVAARPVGTLYAVNTWGAVVGTTLTGFVLVPGLGVRATVWVAVALDLAVAASALLLERWTALPAASDAPAQEPELEPAALATPAAPASRRPLPLGVAVVLGGMALSGAASMAYEVAWTRALALTLGSSTYAFAAMLATFLTGLALGSLVAARLLARRAGAALAALGWVEVGVAFLAVALLPAFGRIPEALLAILARTGVSHGASLAAQAGLSFAVMIGPTLLIGTTFPLAVAALGSALGRVGRDVGAVYGANTLGTIAGSMLGGFVLVPALGMQATVMVAAGANLAVGLGVLSLGLAAPVRRRAAVAAGAVAAFALLVAVVPRWDTRMITAGVPVYAASMLRGGVAGVRAARARQEVLLYEEGLSTTVAVTRSATSTMLSVNGKIDASNTRDMRTQLLLGHLGAVLDAAPRRALVIGLASGITAGAVAQHPYERIDVAEIEPAMIEASGFFVEENRHVLADPRVRVLVGDGRHLLAAAAEPYDLIVSEPSNPWIAGVANLFTREFYELAQSRLAPGGVMVQWLQTYSIFGEDMQMVVRTFAEVFPHVSVWAGALGDVLLVATPGPARLDLAALEARLAASPGAREDFERFGWRGDALVYRFQLADEDARRYGAGAPLNTDDRPLLEFSAPRALYAGSAEANEAQLRSFRVVDRPLVSGRDPARAAGPGDRLRAAALRWSEGYVEDAALELDRLGPTDALGPEERAELAMRLFTLGRYPEALAEADRALPLRPDDARLRALRAVLVAMSAPELSPRVTATLRPLPAGWFAHPAALGELVLNLSMERGAPELLPLALEILATAVEVEPSRAGPRNDRAIALALLGRDAEAIEALAHVLRIEPENARAHFNLGRLHERGGRPAEALAAYEAALVLDGSLASARARAEALRAALR